MNEGEKKVVRKMIGIYCRSKHGAGKQPCTACHALEQYALRRLESCPFGEGKPSCAMCPVHCYKNSLRMQIKEVMRFAAPRMLFLHPLDTIRHLYQERRRNRNYAASINVNRNK